MLDIYNHADLELLKKMYLDRLRYLRHHNSCMQEPSRKGLFTIPNCPCEGWVGRLGCPKSENTVSVTVFCIVTFFSEVV